MNLCTFAGASKLLPDVAECTTTIESVSVTVRPNWRHATKTAPVLGSIAIVEPWLTLSAGLLICCGLLHVMPQSSDDESMMREETSVPTVVMREYAM